VFAQLQHCSTFPDFNNYLVYILASGEGMTVEVRQAAGLLLKNNLKTGYATAQAEYRTYIKHHTLRSLGVPHAPLRTTIGTVISVIAVVEGIKAWPELPVGIVQCIHSNDYDHTHGALDALFKVSMSTAPPSHSSHPQNSAAESPKRTTTGVRRYDEGGGWGDGPADLRGHPGAAGSRNPGAGSEAVRHARAAGARPRRKRPVCFLLFCVQGISQDKGWKECAGFTWIEWYSTRACGSCWHCSSTRRWRFGGWPSGAATT